MVSLFIANTDNKWFDFLAAESNPGDVNFWWPHEMSFRAIGRGELLVFRLKSPRNKIGGFGVFSDHTLLPMQLAWETFGRSNGAPTFESLRAAIAELRGDATVGPTTNIGCTVLAEPIFLPPDLWLELPESWSRSIQRGKRYSMDNAEGLDLWNRLQDAARLYATAAKSGFSDVVHAQHFASQARYGAPTLITPRLGQSAFRVAVTEAYGRQCAISDGKVLPALDAAHIKPYGEGGLHTKSNGILFRKDIHSIFDVGYVTIDQDYRFCVSKKVKEIFNNGEEYLRLHGKGLRLPNREMDWPDPAFLEWHNTNRFLG
jgi:putative restriction endonuclease